jgi:hypothetical protein
MFSRLVQRASFGVAVLVGVAVILSVTIAYVAYEGEREQYSKEPGSHQELAKDGADTKNRRPAADRSICREAQTEKEYELCQLWRSAQATRSQADATWWQVGIGIITVIGLAATVYWAAKTGRAAADAAEHAARAVEVQVRLERPLILIRNIRLKGTEPHDSSVEFRIENIGNTPAVVAQIAAEFATMPDKLETEATYSQSRVIDDVIISKDGGMSWSAYHYSAPEPDVPAALKGDGALLFWGFVIYEDVFARLRIKGFGYRGSINKLMLAINESQGAPPTLYWTPVGDTAYNYDYEVDEKSSLKAPW